MDYRQEYDKWCNDPYFDDQTREELKAIAGDDKEIEDRFYRTLEFGTAGLRGVIGAGTNRMNIYTVRQAIRTLENSSFFRTSVLASWIKAIWSAGIP